MAHLIAIAFSHGTRHRLNVVIEAGHPNVGDTKRIFTDMKRQVKNLFGVDLLGTHKIESKEKAAPLMLSDFLAYSYLQMRTLKVDYAAEAPMHVPKRHAGLTLLELLPDSLRRLKEKFGNDRRAAADACAGVAACWGQSAADAHPRRHARLLQRSGRQELPRRCRLRRQFR